MAVFSRITDQDLADLDKEFDSLASPACQYKIQPEIQGTTSPPSPPSPRPSGRLLWLCGAPGLGKSTSAQILGRDHGFVYYEADCFLHLKNPFISLQAPNPSMAQIKQKIMKGKNWTLF